MAKIPVGVGPKLPQIVVLFGATGDLAHKKLLPGLFHLVSAGFISKCRIIGVSLDAIDAEGFRALARDAVFEQHAHQPQEGGLAGVRGDARLRADRGRRRRSEGGGRQGGEVLRRGGPARPLHERAAERRAVGGQDAERGRARRRIARHHGKAVRHRSRERDRAQRRAAQGVRRGPDLPHRPFPRQGAGAEHPRLPVRQRPVRADLEPQFHRSCADRRAGDARHRQPDRLLRADRRLSRHGGHASLPDSGLHGDGAADLARARADQRGEEQGLPLADADRPRRMSCAVSSSATARSRASIRNRTPRPSSRSNASSTIGAGRACRSTCGPASGWPKASASSRSPSASRRRACSRAIPASARRGRTT